MLLLLLLSLLPLLCVHKNLDSHNTQNAHFAVYSFVVVQLSPTVRSLLMCSHAHVSLCFVLRLGWLWRELGHVSACYCVMHA